MKGIHTNSITSGSNKNFARMPTSFVDKPRSTFIRNSTLSTSFNSGKLVPLYLDEILPGDSIDLDIGALITSQTPKVPFMTNVYLDLYAFFVPNRLVWTDWEDFIGGANDDLSVPSFNPYVTDSLSGENLDECLPAYTYFGIPVGRDDAYIKYSALPLRAYFKIWADYFIPEFFVTNCYVEDTDDTAAFGYFDNTITDKLDSGFYVDSPLLPVYKFHDYFTSALDNPQRGGAASLPIGDTAPVLLELREQREQRFVDMDGNPVEGANLNIDLTNGLLNIPASSKQLYLDPNGQMVADLTSNKIAINDLRLAIATQKLLERDNFGQRYVEVLDAHFGVQSPDARLQRAEYLSHKRIKLNVNAVLQNSSRSDRDPEGVGNQGAVSRTHDDDMRGFVRKSFVEHGYFMIVGCVRCENQYENAVDKTFYRKDRLDFYWPTLANIGNQPIYLEEADGYQNAGNGHAGILGYCEAWADYRFKLSHITGLLNKDITDNIVDEDGNPFGTLSFWTTASAMPMLSEATLRFKASILDRVYPVSSAITHQFIANFGFTNKTSRVMPVYSIPSLESKF